MGRPRCAYNIGYCPPCRGFSPYGTTYSRSAEVELTAEEAESLRLKNIVNLDQTQAAKQMGVSQSTFQRLLNAAYKKVSLSLIEGRPLRISQ